MTRTITRLAASVFIACAGLAGAALAQPTPPQAVSPAPIALPETIVGLKARGYLEAFNSRDEQRLKDFLVANYPAAGRRPDAHVQMQARTEGMDPVAILDSKDRSLVLKVRLRKSGVEVSLTFEVEDAEPHALKLVLMMAG